MSHWYDREGNPRYEIEGKKGMRNTTLRDARKHGWVPSVSTVWSEVVSKHMLNKWKETNLMQALHDEMMLRDSSSGILSFSAIEKLARGVFHQKQQDIMMRGTIVHTHLESFFKNGQADDQYRPMCEAVKHKLDEVCGPQVWVAEQAFAHRQGYGGKVDLHSPEWVVDFKTKEFPENPDAKKMVYDDHGVQLAAYGVGLSKDTKRLLNIFIDVGSNQVLEWEHEDPASLYDMFYHALELWKLIKKYNPSW